MRQHVFHQAESLALLKSNCDFTAFSNNKGCKSKLVLFSAPNMVCQMKLGTSGVCEIKRGMND